MTEERSEENKNVLDQEHNKQNSPNVFDQVGEQQSGNASDTPTYTESTQTSESDLLKELVGEGRKYKTVEDLAKSRLEADRFIEQLKQENQGMREDLSNFQEELERKRALEDRLNSIESSQESARNQPDISEKDIESMVERTITERERAQTARSNLEKANDQMIEHFGGPDEAINAVRAKASELGVDVAYLTNTASKSPSAFAKLMDVGTTQNKQSSAPAPSQGTVRTEGLESTQNGERNWSFYEQLRKQSPKEYWKPKVQQQLFKDRERLGDDFHR